MKDIWEDIHRSDNLGWALTTIQEAARSYEAYGVIDFIKDRLMYYDRRNNYLERFAILSSLEKIKKFSQMHRMNIPDVIATIDALNEIKEALFGPNAKKLIHQEELEKILTNRPSVEENLENIVFQSDDGYEFYYGYVFYKGKFVDNNIDGVNYPRVKQAYESFIRIAEQGNAVAQYVVGHMLVNGVGIEPDEHQALKWQFKSAKQGYKNAVKHLKRRLQEAKVKIKCGISDRAPTKRGSLSANQLIKFFENISPSIESLAKEVNSKK